MNKFNSLEVTFIQSWIFLHLQDRSFSMDSPQESTSSTGSWEKQQNLPLKITWRSFTGEADYDTDFKYIS